MAPKISAFPLETLINISKFLSRNDLKNLRLTCKAISNAAECILFRTVCLKINKVSFDRLDHISSHEVMRKHVRTIVYNGRTFDYEEGREGYQEWPDDGPRLPAGMLWKEWRKHIVQCGKEQLQQRYANYCWFLHGQDYVLDNEQNLLLKSLRQFSNISCLCTLNEKYDWEQFLGQRKPEPLVSFQSPFAHEEELVSNSLRGRGDNEHFWVFLQAAVKSQGHRNLLKEIYSQNICEKLWEGIEERSLEEVLQAIRKLQILALNFEDDNKYYSPYNTEYRHYTTQLNKVVTHTRDLTSLSLRFDRFKDGNSMYGKGSCVYLPEIIASSMLWPCLKSLSLWTMRTSQEHLQELLQNHAHSLRSLRLADIDFNELKTDDVDRRDSWILFFQFLNEMMALEHVKFECELSRLPGEVWIIMDRVHSLLPDDCLKCRVEGFITHKLPCPFRPTTKVGPDCYGRHLPWDFEQDDSFILESAEDLFWVPNLQIED